MNYSDLMRYSGYIYMHSILEPEDNSLILNFERCNVNKIPENFKAEDIDLENSHSIEADETLPIVQLKFDWYIAYSVRNESFTVKDDYELSEGKSFRIYSKSRYMDFISLSTIASNFHPGPFQHFGIRGLNHVIDVVATEEPIISLVNRI